MTNHNIKRALYICAFMVFALSILCAQNSGKISGLVKVAETGESSLQKPVLHVLMQRGCNSIM
jgi:hypothetical protein